MLNIIFQYGLELVLIHRILIGFEAILERAYLAQRHRVDRTGWMPQYRSWPPSAPVLRPDGLALLSPYIDR